MQYIQIVQIPKMWRDVGMAVSKTKKGGVRMGVCRQDKDYRSIRMTYIHICVHTHMSNVYLGILLSLHVLAPLSW